MPARMLTLEQVAEDSRSASRRSTFSYAARISGAGKIGGRGQWRVLPTDLEAHIERTWADTSTWIDKHPFTEGEEPPDGDA